MLATNVCKHEEIKNCSIKHFKEFHSINIFWLCNPFHLQEKKKKAMGTPIAANHVNLSMDMFGRSLLNDLDKKTVKKKLIRLCFIDEIVFETSLRRVVAFCQK